MARRAAPLPPEQRRAAIVAATIPLVRLHGLDVTTSQIALAAGLAEGTLFRVFPDKESLLQAAVEHACDPEPTERALAAIDRSLSMRDQMICAVEILQRRVEQLWHIVSMLGRAMPPKMPQRPLESSLTGTLAMLLDPFRDELRCEPIHAARLLRAMTFAGSHPRLIEGPALTAAETVTVLLDGLRRRDDEEA
jgi:AcrR family transcriptional regulator